MKLLSGKSGNVKLLLSVVVIAFSAGAIIYSKNIRQKSFSTAPLKRGGMTSAIYGSAQVKTDDMFDLKLGAPSRIVSLKTAIGNSVKRGQNLIEFDNMPSFRSPIDGIVTALNYRVGETVFAQSSILSIVSAKNLYLEMTLDQKSIRHIKAGQAARISFEGFRELKVEGKVRSSFSNNGLFYSIIDFDSSGANFLPGMSADVAIVVTAKTDVLLAPNESIKNGKVIVMREGKQVEKIVSLGLEDGKFTEVLGDNLQVGEELILHSQTAEKTGGN
jgi:multidrug efflux pump subunit AcrA (membrane-fusion protein)